MRNIICFFGVLLLVIGFVACGDKSVTGSDPREEPDDIENPAPLSHEYDSLAVSVMLPGGSNIDLKETTVMSLSVVHPVDEDGRSHVAFNDGAIQLAYLFDASDNLLMAGFISEDDPVIDIQTTTEVLFYIGFGTLLQPTPVKEKLLAEVSTIPGFEEFRSEIEQMFIGNPRMLQGGAYADMLREKMNQLQKLDEIDIPTNQLNVDAAMGILERQQGDYLVFTAMLLPPRHRFMMPRTNQILQLRFLPVPRSSTNRLLAVPMTKPILSF